MPDAEDYIAAFQAGDTPAVHDLASRGGLDLDTFYDLAGDPAGRDLLRRLEAGWYAPDLLARFPGGTREAQQFVLNYAVATGEAPASTLGPAASLRDPVAVQQESAAFVVQDLERADERAQAAENRSTNPGADQGRGLLVAGAIAAAAFLLRGRR